ncbi:MAG: sodium:proton antiporter [Sulfurimonas sp.]|nr:sodium:proton antiporter [Sulfurimonas sp.]MBU3940230.1 cation:proton antiporter [bacterium]MBU4024094.1 cation:proton antiporter [bacterium]MBU4058078.1 cation:proton antiporter [bacterium]MBU4110453.1 cation:proton antiporter [bacterium]
MLEIFVIILTLILVSKILEEATKIPFVLLIIVLSYGANHLFDLSLLGDNFQSVIYMMLPIILIPDILGLSRSELKENFSNIFYLAFTAVLISIAIAVGITYTLDSVYDLTIFHLLILFTPLMATDVVSVNAIFSRLKVPQTLKLFAEGESLFNDITAMIIFFFIALPILNGEDISLPALAGVVSYTLVLSVLIGAVIGLLGYYSFKISKNNFDEFISIYIMGSLAFLLAEKIHLSGILAVVVSLLLFKYLFDKEGHYRKKNYNAILSYLNKQSTNTESFRAYKKEAHYFGLFANAVIFISIANVINLDLLWKYKLEILYVFLLTTVIRYALVASFIFYKKLPLRWGNILTLSGMKGGLALIMIVSLSPDFIYKEMYLAVTLGVVILSIFLYTAFLMSYLFFEKDALMMDMAQEHNISFHDINDILQKEEKSGAYNEIMFEDFIEKEIIRTQRDGHQFSLVSFEAQNSTLKTINNELIGKGDYFGKIDEKNYAVLLTNCTLNDALAFSEKLKKYLHYDHIAIAEYMAGDTKEFMLEKLHKAMKDKQEIGVEV